MISREGLQGEFNFPQIQNKFLLGITTYVISFAGDFPSKIIFIPRDYSAKLKKEAKKISNKKIKYIKLLEVEIKIEFHFYIYQYRYNKV